MTDFAPQAFEAGLGAINQKGGVGKTTTSVNLAHALSMIGKNIGRKVLAVDLDPQGHMATSLGVTGAAEGLDQVFRDRGAIADYVVTARENLDLLAPGDSLNEFEGLNQAEQADVWMLNRCLQQAPEYDFVIIDCPPSSGLLGMNAMFAADEILIPVPGDYLAMVGLSRLLAMLDEIERDADRSLIKWIVVTRFDGRRRHSHEVYAKLQEYFPTELLPTVISESVSLTESPSFGKTIFEHQGTSRAATEYAALARDLISSTSVTRKFA